MNKSVGAGCPLYFGGYGFVFDAEQIQQRSENNFCALRTRLYAENENSFYLPQLGAEKARFYRICFAKNTRLQHNILRLESFDKSI